MYGLYNDAISHILKNLSDLQKTKYLWKNVQASIPYL